jgi:hypothetical protein
MRLEVLRSLQQALLTQELMSKFHPATAAAFISCPLTTNLSFLADQQQQHAQSS